MIGKLILIAALVAGAIGARQWWKKSSLTSAQRGKAVALAVLAIILVLAVSGKLNPLFAALAAAVPIAWKLLAVLSRHLPTALKAWHLFNQNATKAGTTNGVATNLDRTEALQILGLDESASRDDIINAHRRLIQKVHPDRGGSDYLAARINLAKDILLKDRN
jgi:hypothetical protein